VRRQSFLDIWRHSPAMSEVRSVRLRDLPMCAPCSHIASCSRCPGLALMEGDFRGPSLQDCGKSWARTGLVPTGCPVPLSDPAIPPRLEATP
jgi:hypothetical protein